MPSEPIFCDHNAGAPVRPEAFETLVRALAAAGNPSSTHGFGRRAKAAMETAREQVAAAIGASAQNVVFTSGATEALHLAVSAARRAGVQALIVSALEHDALAEGAAALWPGHVVAPATANGLVDLDALESLLVDRRGALVALMLANNETGAIQPVRQAARLVREAGGLLLVDAAQALGRIGVDMAELDASYLVLSSHKAGGPPGVGALALAPGAPFASPRLGGGQELGRRPGTENVPAIAGFGAAVAAATRDLAHEAPRLSELRDAFEAGLKTRFPDAAIFAAAAPRLPNTSLFALPGLPAETALIALDLAGVAVSSGAACSSGKVRPSRVLSAMGVDAALARCALRVSFGWSSKSEDVPRLLDALTRAAARVRPVTLEGAA